MEPKATWHYTVFDNWIRAGLHQKTGVSPVAILYIKVYTMLLEGISTNEGKSELQFIKCIAGISHKYFTYRPLYCKIKISIFIVQALREQMRNWNKK